MDENHNQLSYMDATQYRMDLWIIVMSTRDAYWNYRVPKCAHSDARAIWDSGKMTDDDAMLLRFLVHIV